MRTVEGGKRSIRQLVFGQFDFWQKPNISELDVKARDEYLSRLRALELYCSGVGLKEIHRVTGVKNSMVCYYADRCATLAPDGEPYGCRALLGGVHMKVYERRKECTGKLPGVRGGYSGVLQATLKRYPEIDTTIIGHVKKIQKNEVLREFRLSQKTLHNIFIVSLLAQGASREEWPFNTREYGYNSIGKYMRNILLSDFDSAVRTRGEKDARAHLSVGRQSATLIRADDPYDVVEIDAYHTDCFASVSFRTPEDTYVSVQLSRMWLLVMIDRASTAVLAYLLVYRPEVAAADVIELLRLSLRDHEAPLPVIDNLKYSAEGGLPKDKIPECKYALPSVIMLDGALAHLATKVHDGARKELGFSLNWGPVGHFERRPNVERFFGRIATDLFGRMPSTTGSHPRNGRADDAEEVAVLKNIHADHIHYLLDVMIADYNVTRTEGLSFLTPMEFIRQKIILDKGHMLIRHLANVDVIGGVLLMLKKKVTVRGSANSGRLPYVQLDRVHYTNNLLKDAAILIGKPIIIQIDESDMRTVQAFTMDGCSMGTLYAGGRWADTKHDSRTRKIINSLMSDKIIQVAMRDNPVQVYLDWLTQQNKEITKAKRPKKPVSPSQASEAKRVADAAGLDLALKNPKPEVALTVGVSRLSLVTDSVIPDEMPDLNDLLKSAINKNRGV